MYVPGHWELLLWQLSDCGQRTWRPDDAHTLVAAYVIHAPECRDCALAHPFAARDHEVFGERTRGDFEYLGRMGVHLLANNFVRCTVKVKHVELERVSIVGWL